MRTIRPRNPAILTGWRELIHIASGNSGARTVGFSRFIKRIVATKGGVGQCDNGKLRDWESGLGDQTMGRFGRRFEFGDFRTVTLTQIGIGWIGYKSIDSTFKLLRIEYKNLANSMPLRNTKTSEIL
jgi:hypothetical protein